MSRTTKTVFFNMVDHPLQGRIRVGNAHGSRRLAREWHDIVRGSWHGLRVSVSQCTLIWNDRVLSPKSIRTLDEKFNLDPPEDCEP